MLNIKKVEGSVCICAHVAMGEGEFAKLFITVELIKVTASPSLPLLEQLPSFLLITSLYVQQSAQNFGQAFSFTFNFPCLILLVFLSFIACALQTLAKLLQSM